MELYLDAGFFEFGKNGGELPATEVPLTRFPVEPNIHLRQCAAPEPAGDFLDGRTTNKMAIFFKDPQRFRQIEVGDQQFDQGQRSRTINHSITLI
ncbi:hypothetical protein BBF93_06615 [Hyphomonas sp. CACIAM 19H1]|nr:hypothetical protein BBF93_06615 [Hyphomonas sp. CACIAM 19H1]